MECDNSQNGNQRIVIVSDLHLGVAHLECESSRDREFLEFIDNLVRDASEHGVKIRLILLGDTFDFPSTVSKPGRTRESDDDLAERLQTILGRHPEFVAALRTLLDLGHSLDLMPGNHDPGLMRPAVQAEIRAILEPVPTHHLRFHPWILYIPNVLYAEHGNQYHDINSFPEWLRAKDVQLTAWKTPIGAKLDDFVMAMHRAKENDSTGTSFGARRWGSAPTKAARVSLFGFKAAGEAIAVCSPARTRRRNQYRTDLLAEEASEIDIPTTALVRIDELAERNARVWPRRLLGSCAQAIRHRIRKTHDLSSESATVAMSEQERRDHFRSAAGEIGTILAEEGYPVPVCVFGHTHLVDCVRLADLTAVNAGSWLVEVPVAGSEAAKQRLLPFAQIDPGSATGPLRVACLAWDSGRHASVHIRVTDTN